MDANGTRFSLRYGAADWAEPLAAPGSRDVAFDARDGAVALAEVARLIPVPDSAAALTAADRRGADRDRFGSWYWIDADRRRIRIARGAAPAADFWSVDQLDAPACPPEAADTDDLFAPALPPTQAHGDLRLSGLCVTPGDYLAVGTLRPAGLLVFDLHGSGPPFHRTWPEEARFRPFDFEATPDGGLVILECATDLDPPEPDAPPEPDPGPRHRRLDARFRPMPTGADLTLAPEAEALFRVPGAPPETRPELTFPEAWPADLGSPAPVVAPRAICALPDGGVLVLDTPRNGPSSIARFDGDQPRGEVVLDAALLAFMLGEGAAIRAHDMAFLPDPDQPPGPEFAGDLAVASETGDQAFRFRLTGDADGFALALLPDHLPLRRFAGRGIVAAAGRAHYDLDERWLPIAARPQRRHRADGVVAGLIFDGRAPGCVWHRLVFDGRLPEGASLTVESRAADDPATLADAEWRTEPAPIRRGGGPETPPRLPFSPDGTVLPATCGGSPDRAGTFETLFQTAAGRWLELRLTLAGGGRVSPRIQALRVHYPRFSYLERYLPDAYREDPVSAAFLDRFLANPEGMFTTLEDRVAAAETLFDTRTAAPGHLDWLAGWLGATLDPDWEDWRRRLFIDNAELLFRWRGTVPGLRALLSVAVDDCPDLDALAALRAGRPALDDRPGREIRVVESFLLRRFGGVELGDPGGETAAPGLAFAAEGAPYAPEQGAGPLHDAWRNYVTGLHAPDPAPASDEAREAETLAAVAAAWGRPLASLSALALSPVVPASAGEAADWRAFLAGPVGFVHAAVAQSDAPAWRGFLERRYGAVSRLNAAWQRLGDAAFPGFAAIPLPAEGDYPAAGARLEDWLGFVTSALPIARAAHRFSVLVPAAPGEPPSARSLKVERVRALVAREKPAHAAFDVRPFWALFRVGDARLGIDTTLGESARFAAIELGRSALAEGNLAWGLPWTAPDRRVVGRDAPGATTTGETRP